MDWEVIDLERHVQAGIKDQGLLDDIIWNGMVLYGMECETGSCGKCTNWDAESIYFSLFCD